MSSDPRIVLEPRLPVDGEAARSFVTFANELAKTDVALIDSLRDAWLSRISPSATDGQILRVCISVLADLIAQGWSLGIEQSVIAVAQPGSDGGDATFQKDRVKRGHLRERDYQLSQPSVREFIAEMERPRLGRQGWTSILSLMRDGRELAARLRECADEADMAARVELLKQCIDPYLQPVVGNEVCSHTGLPLADIWRYFRHTWTNHYNSTPGRQVSFLIRDRAAENHPVIGIGAFGSAVVQLSVRDEWVGWTPETIIKRLEAEPGRIGPWIIKSLEELISGIYAQDFIHDGILNKRALAKPDERVIVRLNREALKAGERHRADPQAREHKASTKNGNNWVREAKSFLFRSKRAKMLAQFLTARAVFNRAGFTSNTAGQVADILKNPRAIQAVRIVLRHTKAAHVGVDMMDITVCGAVAPYGPILGGKLVSLLLAGPDAVTEYERRYRSAVSVIASSMAGKAIVRSPRLVLLGTTSLYGTASSQYNRLRVPAEALGGPQGASFEYRELGHSVGFGSFHFSTRTLDEIEVLLAQQHQGQMFNSIFGEGVNPKLRKIRSGLEAIGFPADEVLRHGDKRLVYGIALASNFRDVLLGITKRRVPIIPATDPGVGSVRLVDYWMRRWLAGRIERAGVLEQVASHRLVHPVTHGARVALPEVEGAPAMQQFLVEAG